MRTVPLENVLGGPPDIPEFLYHYTNAASFIEIVKSKCLWATDVLFVNDSTEYIYTLNLFKEEVDALPYNTPGKGEATSVPGPLHGWRIVGPRPTRDLNAEPSCASPRSR